FAIALAATGSAFVAGSTRSVDFRFTGLLQDAGVGRPCAFVAQVDFAGTASPALTDATCIGGQMNMGTSAAGVAVDAAGTIYVVGTTGDADFPTVNPAQSVLLGVNDAFLAEISSATNAADGGPGGSDAGAVDGGLGDAGFVDAGLMDAGLLD